MIGHVGTVTAVSTPPGKGGVAVIRVSGENAFAVAEKCFVPKNGKPLSANPPRRAVYGNILLDGEIIDDGLLLYFPAPNSYTGEDVVELSCHGGPLLTGMVLEATLKAGAIPAPPGEFTRRAYLTGKLSLSDAEAVGLAIDAVTRAQVRLSAEDSRDRLSDAVGSIHDRLLTLLSSLYASIDYPEEDLADLSREQVSEGVFAILTDLSSLGKTYRTGRAIREGVPAAIAGKPNVGKSAIFNRLLGEEKAIVTEIPGTTRDVLEYPLPVGRALLRLADTAGLRETDDPVETIGVERAKKKIGGSEVLLLVLDTSRPLEKEDTDLLALAKEFSGVSVLLLNKSDLAPAWDKADLPTGSPAAFAVSAKTGEGFNAVTDYLEKALTDENLSLGSDAIVVTARQSAAIDAATKDLSACLDALKTGVPVDAAASLAEAALASLSEVDGRTVTGEIVDEIFSHFCVGK
ncbi:MAG: tRNA uridine-5-carboxymethylaminomethyl(34) synthesis GTPase MnmE [Clostridia bacterium]|nr:tRNA uridine-5-carboxymethylaminomethyl(34) synthesis GTPase MnmE [Clostridia bacterium]